MGASRAAHGVLRVQDVPASERHITYPRERVRVRRGCGYFAGAGAGAG